MKLKLSRKAREMLDKRTSSLAIEMELYFSCLIRKQVRFPETTHADAKPVESGHDSLKLYFRPVMAKSCGIDEVEGSQELIPFPLQKSNRFTPKWFSLDYKKGEWVADFGYHE